MYISDTDLTASGSRKRIHSNKSPKKQMTQRKLEVHRCS